MVSGNGIVHNDCFKTSPVQIQGTRHFVTQSSYTTITIGCRCHSIEYWLENAEEIGKAEGYTVVQIAEYKKYIALIAEISERQAKERKNEGKN
jgi:hypothetical protein